MSSTPTAKPKWRQQSSVSNSVEDFVPKETTTRRSRSMPPAHMQDTMLDSDSNMVIMIGSLWKEKGNWISKIGASMGNLRFHMRFFALINTRPARLCAWKEESMYRKGEKPEHTIPLHGCSLSCAEKHTGNPHSFGIFHPERSEVYLLCPDADQHHKWMQALEGMLINPQELRLTDFDIVTMVGRGAFGQVFQVQKKDTKRVYALKILDKNFVKNQAQVENTKSERKVLEIVNHPFIVSLHYAFQTDSALCLVMDFINGGELFMHLRQQGCFCESDARMWAAEILLALEYLHSMDIIYRDLKPENVLLDKEGHIKITDFGLARDRTDTVNSSAIAGSAYYMAPEVLLMQGHDVQADWWSLGILIYEMLVGLPPFHCANTRDAYQRLLSSPIEFPEHVSNHARELICRLLKTNPVHRLGAKTHDRGKSKLLAEGWGDGMSIKAQKWFDGVRWDQVLLKHVNSSFTPRIKDDADVSNFDERFTCDQSWRNSKLLRHDSFDVLPIGEYGDFNYVKKNKGGSHSPAPRAPAASRPSMTLDELTQHDGACVCANRAELAAKYAQLTSATLEPLPPWTPPRAAASTPGSAPASPASASDASSSKGMLRHVSQKESGEYLRSIPRARQGYLESTKKGSFGYTTPKRKFLRLVPSLGCLLVYRDMDALTPSKVLPVPPAGLVFPKHGAVPVGRKVYVHSVAMLVGERKYTFVCENQVDRDGWVAALRTVGERWRCSDRGGLQLAGLVQKAARSRTLMHAVFGSGSTRETWQAVQRDGQTVEMMSENGLDRDGSFRYDGEHLEEGRHGRGLSSWAGFENYYDGYWRHGRKEGYAMVKVEGLGLYEGWWDPRKKREGFGKMVYEDGSTYEGWWVADCRQGFGYQWTAATNEAHHGLFYNGLAHGHGTRHYASGKVYCGDWLNGKQHGGEVLREPDPEGEGEDAAAAGPSDPTASQRKQAHVHKHDDSPSSSSPRSSEQGERAPETRQLLDDAAAFNFDLGMELDAGEKKDGMPPCQLEAPMATSEPVSPENVSSRPGGMRGLLTSLLPKLEKELDEWGGFGRGQLGSFGCRKGNGKPGKGDRERGTSVASADTEKETTNIERAQFQNSSGTRSRSQSTPAISMTGEYGTHGDDYQEDGAASDDTGPITAMGIAHSPTFGSPPKGEWGQH